jgi:hypothetical protein
VVTKKPSNPNNPQTNGNICTTNPAACPTNPTTPTPTVDAYTPSSPQAGSVHVDFQIPRGSFGDFSSLPWPSELYRTPVGKIDWSNYPGKQQALIGRYVDQATTDVDGFSISTGLFFHFSGEPTQPPTEPGDTMSIASPIFLVNVDPASNDRGTFIPLQFRYYPTATTYVPQGMLAMKPVPGMVMRPNTLYASVVRRELNDKGGQPLGTTADLEYVKWTDHRIDVNEERARLMHYDVLNYLATLGVARVDVAGIALFRTQTPAAVTAKMFDVATHLPSQYQPKVLSAAWDDTLALDAGTHSYWAFQGEYCTPNFNKQIVVAAFGG